MVDARAAQERGYFLPDEDERLRRSYRRYLEARQALLEMVLEFQPHLPELDLRVFAIAFGAASSLMASASLLVELTRGRPVVHRKLDEAHSGLGLPRKTFTQIFKSYTHPATAWRYRQARNYFHRHEAAIEREFRDTGLEEILEFLREEACRPPRRTARWWAPLLSYRLYSLTRWTRSGYQQAMFHLFRMSGEAIADRRQPFRGQRKPEKRVAPEVVASMARFLQPGDIIVTRHDHALSNVFLPGFWPHAAFFIGSPEDRRAVGLPDAGQSECPVLEAKKDGVRFRPLSETLSVDCFVVLRPRLEPPDLAEVLTRALGHEGKLYDFLFDFRWADRLACTEVIYRSFHGTGRWHLELVRQGGRLTLSAENLMRQMLDRDLAEVVAISGVCPGPPVFGAPAREILRDSLPG